MDPTLPQRRVAAAGSGGVEAEVGGEAAGHFLGLRQVGVADDDHAVGDQGGAPVPAGRADREQVDRDHVVAVLGQQGIEADDVDDPAGAAGPLEDAGRVVVPGDGLEDPALGDGLGPGGEQVGVGGVVHHVDGACARRARADLAEHDLAVGLAVPLHVGEAVPEARARRSR